MGRYSAYVYALALPTLALACAPWLAQAGTPRRLAGGGLAILLILSGLQHLVYLPLIPRAAQQVYLQSWQMHRLLVEFWQKPAFALDIGAVSWLNPQPVWDLSGLASEPIRQMLLTYRVGSTSQTYLADVTRKYQTQLALMMDRPNMIAPASWVPLARLELPDANIILHRNMDIYATSQEAVPAAKAAVLAWGASLPPQARLGLNPAVFAP